MRRVFSFTGDGWFPRVSLGGVVCFGNLESRAWQRGGVWPPVPGRQSQLIGPDTVTFTREIGPNLKTRYERPLSTGVEAKTGDDPALVAGNEFEADAGHWGSWLDVGGGRLVIDGRVVGFGFRGVHMRWPWTASVFQEQEVVWFLEGREYARAPLPPRANVLKVATDGAVTYGYFWEVGCIRPDRTVTDVTMTPWRREGVATIVLADGTPWTWAPTESPGGRPAVIGCPLRAYATQQFDAVIIEDFPAAYLDAAYLPERHEFLIAGCSDQGALQVWTCSSDEPRGSLLAWGGTARMPFGVRPAEPKALGYFYEDGKYGRYTPPRNCTITGAGLWESDTNNDGIAELPEDIDMLLDGAIARAQLAFVDAQDIQRPTVRARWSQVLGVFTHEPDTPQMAREWVAAARYRMDIAHLPLRPVITILREERSADAAFAGIGDAVSPEIYFRVPETSYEAQLAITRARIDEVCRALAPSPLYLSIQAFDRNRDQRWKDAPWALDAIQQAANEALSREQVKGLWWFAYARPGGVRDYPQLERWHAAQIAVTTPPSAPIDPRPPKPKPPTGGDMTPEQVRANCATKWPPDVTLEILRRFNKEVVHERDQVGEDNVSGGAAGIYLWPNVAASVYPNLAAQGPPTDPDPAKVFATWMGWFVPGFVNAAKEYWQAQGRPDRLGPQ